MQLLNHLRPASVAVVDIQGMIGPAACPRRGFHELLFGRASAVLPEAAALELEASLLSPCRYALCIGDHL